jgi:PAS domain S-box-containing protein
MRRERRNAFRSSLVVEPVWKRIALAVAPIVVYALAFIPLYRQAGVGVSALAIFPVVVLGWLFGAWGGLLAGLLSVPLNAYLLQFVHEPGWAIVMGSGGAEGSALVIVVGCVIGLLRDLGARLDRHLTEWRRAERALRETEDRYRVLFERSRDPLYLSRRDGHVVEANDALLRVFGYSRSELLDLDVSALYEDPTDLDRFREDVEKRGWVEDFPVRLRTKDGAVRDCLVTATARYGGDGEVAAYQGSIRDVSESGALHALADRRTRESREAVSELEAFTYTVSHDLRTHLVTIGGFASILWSDHRQQLDEKGQGFLRRIVDASRRMEAFVQDLLTYSRVRKADARLESVSLTKVVELAITALERPIAERDASVRVEGALPEVEADATLLERAVENLISNAVKFVPADRVPRVVVRAESSNHHVRFSVEDNGIGVTAEDLPKVFRPFERLDPGRFEGTGVGLTIVQRAAERMGGEAGVTSEPGRGSTFWILLRAARERSRD